MSNQNCKVWGIILAGGEGKRLQSFVHSNYGTSAPKQFCTFTGTRSMLRHTIDRAEMLIRPEQLLIVVGKDQLCYAGDQLADRPPGTIIIQPCKRETVPAILYPLLKAYQRDPEAVVCIFPSDHFILHEETFMQYIEFSSEFVTSDPESIMLLGVIPQQPHGEYGWIVTSERIANDNAKRVYNISRFVEKPDPSTAYRLYLTDSLWNTMVIVSKAKTLLATFKMLTPTAYDAFWEIKDFLGSSLEERVVEEVYSKLLPMNFSYSILEKNPIGLRAVRMQGVYWNDWGDAARVQSDIQCFCPAKEILRIPLPFLEIDQLPVCPS